MIRIEAWARNPEGTYDVSLLVESGRRYAYTFCTEQTFQQFRQHLRHQRYHAAFALIPAVGAETSPRAGAHQRGRFHPMDGRTRPDPGEGATTGPAPVARGTDAETGFLIGPDASPLIASADNRSVMLYPF